ncbi:hypothetical protein MMC28_004781 [Mycoblastus sanguinarius]|nr:hypothetical protein [Mycoblastus sanguinarius]
MDIHLNDRKSPNSLVRRLAVNKLDSCIGILDELRNNFPEAGLVYKTFTAAINEQPNPDELRESSIFQASDRREPSTQPDFYKFLDPT